MNRQDSHSSSHAVVTIRLHIVLATKHRRKAITPSTLADLREVFAEILSGWRCSLWEFGGEADHVHLLIDIHPALQISVLINNLKTASSRRIRAKYADHLRRFCWKPFFWHRTYVGSVGHGQLGDGETLRTVSGTERIQNKDKYQRTARLTPSWRFAPRRGNARAVRS